MSTNPKPSAGSGWTDRERLVYLINLLEHSDGKLNFKTAPLPPGRSVIACERMLSRLKTSLKAELDALRDGVPMPTTTTTGAGDEDGAGASKAKKKSVVRKRKSDSDSAGVSTGMEGAVKKRQPAKRTTEERAVVKKEEVEHDTEEADAKAEEVAEEEQDV